MRMTSPMGFITVGGRLRYLAGAKPDHRLAGDGMILANLRALRSDLVALGFNVSTRLFDSLLKKYIDQFEQEVQAGGEKAKLGAALDGFAHDLVDFEQTMFAEAETRRIATPTQRRIPLDHLLDSPQHLLGAGVFEVLSAIAQEDFKEACKCLAFERPTAAAFHVLRCVEECIRRLHCAYFPRAKKAGNSSWGDLTGELTRKERNPKPDSTLLAHLDHLRTRFRNPTDHPEKLYDLEEAEDLLHIAVDAINRCLRDPKLAAQT